MNFVKEEYGITDVEREVDSTPQIKKLVNNLDKPESHNKDLILNH